MVRIKAAGEQALHQTSAGVGTEFKLKLNISQHHEKRRSTNALRLRPVVRKSGNHKWGAVFAIDPFGRFASTRPCLARRRIAVFGCNFAGGFG
jgi:hypothetical protein